MTQRISAAEYQTLLFEQQTEEQFVDWIIKLAQAKGWHRIHHRPAQTAAGRWITAMQGDAGFVDLVLARSGSALHLWEAKSEDGALRPEQRAWLEAMGAPKLRSSSSGIWWPSGRGYTVGVVRPSMRDEITAELS